MRDMWNSIHIEGSGMLAHEVCFVSACLRFCNCGSFEARQFVTVVVVAVVILSRTAVETTEPDLFYHLSYK